MVSSVRTKGNEHKLQCREFCLNVRKILLAVREVKHWSRLPREAVGSPSFEILKTQLDEDLSNLLCFALFTVGAGGELDSLHRSLPTSPVP